jgi:nitrite reductase/ring-hydroxylating ferredoxin subunit
MSRLVKLTSLDQLPPGTAREFECEGHIVALFHVDGQISAIDGICPHQGGPLAEGELARTEVTCPWHGWRFNVRSGECLTGRIPRQRVYEVKVVGSDILIALP